MKLKLRYVLYITAIILLILVNTSISPPAREKEPRRRRVNQLEIHKDCNKYFKWSFGVREIKVCPRGTFFDDENLRCAPKRIVDCKGRNVYEKRKKIQPVSISTVSIYETEKSEMDSDTDIEMESDQYKKPLEEITSNSDPQFLFRPDADSNKDTRFQFGLQSNPELPDVSSYIDQDFNPHNNLESRSNKVTLGPEPYYKAFLKDKNSNNDNHEQEPNVKPHNNLIQGILNYQPTTESNEDVDEAEWMNVAEVTSSVPDELELLDNGCPRNPHILFLLPHETHCNYFYYCIFGEKVPKACPGNLHFNRFLQLCDVPSKAGCIATIRRLNRKS